MKGRQRPLEKEFTFAGFTFPRYLATLDNIGKTKQERMDRYKFTGGYYHAPKPGADGQGFYLDDSMRWKWADEVNGAGIDHSGWYTDEHGDAETMRGIVILLPHGRCLAGWSMGEGMASGLEYTIYTDEIEAARAADSIAESAAEEEREYQAQENERIRQEDEEEERRQEELARNLGTDEEETTY